MSLYDKKKITCPVCFETTEFILWESITVAVNPELREKLFSGELFTHRCKCGARVNIESPLLYNDIQHKFMISYIPQNAEGNTKDYPVAELMKTFPPDVVRQIRKKGLRLRSVSTRFELLDKIVQLESKYSDQQLEMLKLYLKETLEQMGVPFDATTEMFFYHVQDGQLYCTIPMDNEKGSSIKIEDELLKKFFPEGMNDETDGFSFMKINQEWARKKLDPEQMM